MKPTKQEVQAKLTELDYAYRVDSIDHHPTLDAQILTPGIDQCFFVDIGLKYGRMVSWRLIVVDHQGLDGQVPLSELAILHGELYAYLNSIDTCSEVCIAG